MQVGITKKIENFISWFYVRLFIIFFVNAMKIFTCARVENLNVTYHKNLNKLVFVGGILVSLTFH